MLFEQIADLTITIEATELSVQQRETSSDFTRATTTVALSGRDETGRGEDVSYDQALHQAFADAGLPDLTGSYTVAEFSELIGGLDLFPTPPKRDDARHYRRWAIESAALDLALRQNDTDLASALNRSYDPVRFVVSTRLGDPPSLDRLEQLCLRNPDIELKLDPTPDWTTDLAEDIAETDRVRILDLKGQYEGTDVDQPADAGLYRLVVEQFPNAIIEDPKLTDETSAVLSPHESRIAWDAPITDVECIRNLAFEPTWINIKPSRFGTVESLFESIEYCLDHNIQLYGGGQFELDVGRRQIQTLASIFYPDAPNDVAPRGYNEPNLADDLPSSPLDPEIYLNRDDGGVRYGY